MLHCFKCTFKILSKTETRKTIPFNIVNYNHQNNMWNYQPFRECMKQVALRARDVFRKLVFKSQRRRNDPLNFNYNHGAIKLVISSIIPPMIRCFNTLRDVCTVQTTQNVQKIMSKFMNFVNIFEITMKKTHSCEYKHG